jgi:serine/threonine protein kinase
MSEVYVAEHAWNERKAAIKVLRLSHAHNAEARERMNREAKFLTRFRHPNVVLVFEANVTAHGIVWIA